ncbi:MAG: EAL domain-containing protein [Sneathiellales bacterium]|nr:EAL domain-containing protein [Sneathiellales bacterium]
MNPVDDKSFPSTSNSPVPSLSERLLNSIARMQECEDTRQFCRVTLEELQSLFPKISAGQFLQLSGTETEYEPTAACGDATGLGTDFFTPFTNELKIAQNRAAMLENGKRVFLPLTRGGDVPAILVLVASKAWNKSELELLEQFSLNAARGLETTALLQEARLLAYNDVLTSLGNRLSFKKEIQAEINLSSSKEDNRFAVIQFVLDNLPELNIALGHAAGDELLRQTANQLDRIFPNAIALARSSGDGFGICTPIRTNEQITEIPDLINDLFDVFLPDELKQPHLVPRIGISLYPMDGHNSDQLWQNTNIALAHTKKPGSPNFCYYDSQIETEIHGRITLNNALREGISEGQLSLNYQPQLDLNSGEITGVEALLRWERKKGEFVPANTFIPIAEASGLLGPISEWVLFEACSQRVKWTEQGVPSFPVAVNISLSEFQSEEFVSLVRRVLFETALVK